MFDENQITDEMMEEGQEKEASLASKKAASNQRNAANNAKIASQVADAASKSANPYLKAAGTAVKGIDAVTGGKASETLGKGLNLANKLTPGGRLAQAALNKMSESGAADRIGNALSKKNQNPTANKPKGSKNANSLGANNSSSTRNEESDSGESGTVNYKATFKFIITALMVMTPVLVIIIFCNLFISASQIFINSIDLGTADSLSHDSVEQKIENNKNNWDNEIKDDDENLTYASNSDIYILNNVKNTKYVQVARAYNEADLAELNDFYGNTISGNEVEDMDIVYNFYFKLYYIYLYYNENYDGVKLDLPLLMATLNVQSKDKNIVFSSNTIGYDQSQVELKQNNERFDYKKEHIYTSTSINSQYDIEVLAQHMVSYQARESCLDSNGKEITSNILRDDQIGTQVLTCEENQTYKVSEAKWDIDEVKYREFLPEFLEKKYYINSSNSNNAGDDSGTGDNGGTGGNYLGDITTCALTVIGDKYYKTVNPATKNCNVAGFYDDNDYGLEPSFYANILDLIAYAKTKGCGASIISGHRTYARQQYFYNCYINKNCNNGNLAAKPGKSNHEYGIAADLRYTPKNKTCLEVYRTSASMFGLEYPLWYHSTHPENWHIEPINIIKGTP